MIKRETMVNQITQKTIFNREKCEIHPFFSENAKIVLYEGDTLTELKKIPDNQINLIVTSPPYNVGKEYEAVTSLDRYLENIKPIIYESVRVLSPNGSICWQVGNYVKKAEVFPLDIFYYPIFKEYGLKLRNRIIWHFGHGLHASKRLSGRYETLLWFTKSNDYTFNLDAIRIPSKYPGKTNFKPGPKYGLPSGNPLGKNPSDYWEITAQDWEKEIWDIPNVKANHPEKTIHPCQFPIELVQRCVLACTNKGDWVLDPFVGVGSTMIAAIMHQRKAFGCEMDAKYVKICHDRIDSYFAGTLKVRPLGKPIHKPTGREKVSQIPESWKFEKYKHE